MCYYNGQRVTRAEFIQLKQLEKAVKNYDFLNKGVISGFSEDLVAVLLPNDAKTNFDIVQMEWGFLPAYIRNREHVQKFRLGYKDSKGKWHTGYTTQNAKAENLFINEEGTKESIYAEAARRRRCLVISTGFYEWRHVYRNHKKTGRPLKTPDKYPYYISVTDQEYFYMAGIWQEWIDKDTGEVSKTLSIVTAPATDLMEKVHNSKKRMPTILSNELAWEWMMEEISDDRILEIAKTGFPAEQMSACSISKEFQAALDPTEPFDYPELPALELSIADDEPAQDKGFDLFSGFHESLF
ncbi:Putative SOS response-associated peptidase YedK [Mucilaginibacter gossypiicola]|uniref:Abasic site processing protein n=1 Tax=Mucilaginibacter gossypiicola TaxID=551995 RepID=A0A1H8LTY7_9SPHI|nr:SOS response-associated peptidase family protein [Mucilaginibacter gossypiicola]SEO08523.1 Putative SOS response-associated peptidase YedK [Mucilaginibacter gossypiicola]